MGYALAPARSSLAKATHAGEAYAAHRRRVDTHRALQVVRYEDMLADPDKAFAALTQHLQLDPTRRHLARAIECCSFARLQAQEKQKGFREQPANADRDFCREGRAGQWKDVPTPAQIGHIVRAHGEQTRRFGYLPLY